MNQKRNERDVNQKKKGILTIELVFRNLTRYVHQQYSTSQKCKIPNIVDHYSKKRGEPLLGANYFFKIFRHNAISSFRWLLKFYPLSIEFPLRLYQVPIH